MRNGDCYVAISKLSRLPDCCSLIIVPSTVIEITSEESSTHTHTYKSFVVMTLLSLIIVHHSRHTMLPHTTSSPTHSDTHDTTPALISSPHTPIHSHSLTHTHTHSITHSLTHWLTHMHTHAQTLSHTHSLSHSLTHMHTHAHTLTHTYTNTYRWRSCYVSRIWGWAGVHVLRETVRTATQGSNTLREINIVPMMVKVERNGIQ